MIWRIARDCGSLDLNSSYAYLLWCRDFAATSRVVRVDGRPVGFVVGYRRPDEPDTLVVWQVAVDANFRGKGLATAMLDSVAGRREKHLETTITVSNTASIELFTAFAKRHKAAMKKRRLFSGELFPDAHEAEDLYRIGPLNHSQCEDL
jgi:L-2,4-diaminobutyric acid acetyltransferase